MEPPMSDWSKKTREAYGDMDEEPRINRQFYEYADVTTIHGVKYIAERGRTQLEK